jgi:hypothetical protein
VRVGTGVDFEGSIAAPRGKVHVFSRTTFQGCIAAKWVVVERDSVVGCAGCRPAYGALVHPRPEAASVSVLSLLSVLLLARAADPGRPVWRRRRKWLSRHK